MNIVILERKSVGMDVDVSCFEKLGDVVCYDTSAPAEETARRVKDAEVLIVNKTPINETTIGQAEHLKLVCEFATGYDNVDLEYCRKRGVKVANARGYSTQTVTQHTFALAFYMIEKLHSYDQFVKSGAYAAQPDFSCFEPVFSDICGKTWGIVGMGTIGKSVAGIAQAFGCRVIFYSSSGGSTCTEFERVDFDTLLEESDILSLHCPLSDRTRDLIDARAFKKMKNSAVLVNVARGPVVNNADLYTALMEGDIAAAALDVVEKEPIAADNPLSRIKDSNKLLITPHIGWASLEARTRCVMEVYKNVEAYTKGESRNIVN